MKKIYFTVTNDLTYDQRMHRICGSLANADYNVILVGRKLKTSLPLQLEKYQQKRLNIFFTKGFLLYAEYNLKLFFFLLFKKMDAVCAIDLDTILPCLLISKLKNIKRVYDAHEYFTEMKELLTRPGIRKFWQAIEKFCIPKYQNGYTVSKGLSEQFKKNLEKNYAVIRNLPVLKELSVIEKKEKLIVFQGAVNEARGFEYLIPAMKFINFKLVICGDGNFMNQLKQLIKENEVENKVELKGMLLPDQLTPIAKEATLGIGLAEREGLNQYYALPNKFTEYMHAGLPQIAMNYPEYKTINDQYKVAVLLDNLSTELVVKTINAVMNDDILLEEMHQNALKAREVFCWQNEEKKLVNFYNKLFQA